MNQDEPTDLLTMKEFPQSYREEAFHIWYRLGRPSVRKLRSQLLPMDENGRVPGEEALQQWRTKDEWVVRANDLDIEVARENDKNAIEEKLKMLKRHADVSMSLIEKGTAYLEEHGIAKGADAIRAIALGMERESISRGFRVALDNMGKKSDAELVSYLEQQISRANGTSDDTIDGEATDITDAKPESE